MLETEEYLLFKYNRGAKSILYKTIFYLLFIYLHIICITNMHEFVSITYIGMKKFKI